MKQLYSNFLLPVLIIVIFLTKAPEGGANSVKPAPQRGFDQSHIIDSSGTALSINEKQALNY